jgi:hypothetical protein
MPRDNHPRARQARALERKKPKRPPFDRVLIVTEGSKTEPLYLDDIRKQLRVPSAHIAVLPNIGTEPIQIVDYAVEKFNETREFECVYAVFDRDDHRTYAQALTKAQKLDNTLRNTERQLVRFFGVPTVPCFELWLLLHYQNVFAFNHRPEILTQLGGHIAGYAKGATGIYAGTETLIDAAEKRAVQLRGRFQAAGGVDPYTDVDLLVARLRNIRG